MSQRVRSVDVEVNRVAYSPVGESVSTDTLIADSSAVPDVFAYYVEEVVIQGDTTDVTFGRFDGGSRIGHRLENIKENTESESELRQGAKFLAEQLDAQMPASANEGYLFVVDADVSGGNISDSPANVLVLLKLDTEEDQRLVLDKNNDISEVDEQKAFPPQEQLQKGAVYPKEGIPPVNIPADIKIYQNSPSSYFEQFFDLSSRLPSSVEQGRTVLNYLTDTVRSELDREVSSQDVSTLTEKAEENDGIVDQDVVAESISEITGSEVDSEDVVSDLPDVDYPSISFEAGKLPQTFKHTVYGSSGGTITVKHHSSTDSDVDIQRNEDGVTVRVEGTEIDSDWVER